MIDYRKDFMDFGEKVWLNAASEGPLPLVAAEALQEAVHWKSLPYELNLQRFASVPRDLKKSIARLIGTSYSDVILGNSASYGLHLLANGIPWERGDEILLMQNDFPANILPWLALERKEVKVKQLQSRHNILTPQELAEHVTAKTKLLCLSHVHTFTGLILDIEQLSRFCKEKKIIFVLNLSQSLGTMPVDVLKYDVDAAVAAGYKWLLGPYGTGFAWMRPSLREELEYNHAYWPAMLTDEELQSEGALSLKTLKSARQYDQFGTANFFNFVPLRASIDYLLNVGIGNVMEHHQSLIDQFISGIDRNRYDFISSEQKGFRSSLMVISHKSKDRNKDIYRSLTEKGMYTALWKGNIRIAPHIYNTPDQIKRLLEVLNK